MFKVRFSAGTPNRATGLRSASVILLIVYSNPYHLAGIAVCSCCGQRYKNPRQVANAQGQRYSTCHGFCQRFAALHSVAAWPWPEYHWLIKRNPLPATSTATPPLGAPPAVPLPPLFNYLPSACLPRSRADARAALQAMNKVPGAFAPPSWRG